MNYPASKERLGTFKLNYIFLNIYPYEPTSEFQKLSSHLTFRQSKIKICRTDFSQTKKLKSKMDQNLYNYYRFF